MSSTFWGVFYGLAAGAFWGLSFLIPKLFSGLSPGDLGLARCTGFALLAILVLVRKKKLGLLTGVHWRQAIWLAVTGYSAYYFILIFSIRFAGIPVSSLIIGLLPITISLASRDRVHKPWLFRLSLLLICTGILLLNVQGFAAFQSGQVGGIQFVLGILLSVVSLFLWTLFAVQNGRFLKEHREIPSSDWAAALGVYSLVTILPLTLGEHALQGVSSVAWMFDSALLTRFIAAAVVLGFGCSFFASMLWNTASQRLPTGLLGQLIVSETVFALLYSFIADRRLPTATEASSIALLITGVTLGIRSFLLPKTRSPGPKTER